MTDLFKWPVWLIKKLIWIMFTLVVLALLFESILSSKDRFLIAPGDIYQIDGKGRHLWCEGSGGMPIILDAGASMFSSSWSWVLPELAKSHKVCAFDRAGLGWSELGEKPYDALQASQELNELLNHAQIPKPFVYVGHSLGGMLGQVYHHQYPDDVSALIMIEPGDPKQLIKDISESRGHQIKQGDPIKSCGIRCPMVGLVSHLGLIRLALNSIDLVNDPLYHPQGLTAFKTRTNRSEVLQFLAFRGRYLAEISFQVIEAQKHLYEIPLAVIYGSEFGQVLAEFESDDEYNEFKRDMHNDWKNIIALSHNPMGLYQIDGANHISIIGYEKFANQVVGIINQITTRL